MKETKKKELKDKGWKDTEIKHAEEALEKSTRHDAHFSKIVFWSALLVIVFGNLVVSVVLIPFLVALNKNFLYVIVVLLAGIIGFLYNFLIHDMGHLEKKHHITAGILVPLIALGNVVVMVLLSNRFTADIKIGEPHNPWIIASVFAVAFILPYIFTKIFGKK
tara:strand:- start:883 stop:1371 length:489 start_codon:yes stop_codon:yes gene_type:complete